MATLGIAADRMQTKSFGEEKPAVQGSGEEAWSLNRRGEFAIFKRK
jgi:peptidoglycan-associated lipoprotein